IKALEEAIHGFYGQGVENSPDYGRIINNKQYEGLKAMLHGQKILSGGKYNDRERYLEPTLVDEPPRESALMAGEIFGPILPILGYESREDLEIQIGDHQNPLALYVFSKSRKFQRWAMGHFAFGGGAINDTVVQIANGNLPFGGIGNSGIGHYHGKH